jgi:hypothetical protein
MSQHNGNGDHQDEVVTTAKVEACYFVMERDGSIWSPAAKILKVFHDEKSAEDEAVALAEDHPKRFFGVAVLRSEARHVRKPVEIVRVALPPEEARPFA